MQQFKKKLKNASKDTPQVLCSVNSQLNKEETLSVESGMKNDKLFLNNPEVDQSESNRKQNMSVSVYVIKLSDTYPTTSLIFSILQEFKIIQCCSLKKLIYFLIKTFRKFKKTIKFKIFEFVRVPVYKY